MTESRSEYRLKASKKEESLWEVKGEEGFIGFLSFRKDESLWRIAYDKTAEFWTLEGYETQDEALSALGELKKERDETRLRLLGKFNDQQDLS